MFPVPRIQQLIVPVVAVVIAFITNSVRVAIMVLLAVEANEDGFLYWHEQEGSLIFSLISVALLGLFCFFLIRQNESIEESEVEP
jgi:exosortase/archaeosortase family protein